MTKNDMLGKDGLTVTSAKHVANIAKEMYEAAESRLKAMKLCSRDFTLAVNGKNYRVENESEKADLETLGATLREIGELKSLIAYLREGIKAKEALNRDEAFFALQKEYRSLQAELNKLKAEVDEKVADETTKLNSETAAALQLWTEARKAERLKYSEAVKALRVVIPQNLLGVYEKVKAVL